jgi:large subunit ribosomal protein L17
MSHQVSGRKLDRPTGQRIALFRNQVTDLLEHGKIVTTEAKAKEVRGFAEKMITLGKAGTLAARRQALAFITEKAVVDNLFGTLGPRYASRAGGYTRIIKLGPRLGDGAPLVRLELVE